MLKMIRRHPNIITVIQTRRGSSRLPDKVMMPLAGKPLFVRQAQRVLASQLAGTVVIAATTDKADNIIEKTCIEEGLECFRGDAKDLLDRHYQAALEYKAGVVIKIPSDCPLIDPAIIDRVIHFYLKNENSTENDYDYASNLHPATYPDGNDVEVMSLDILKQAWQEADKEFEREHTTPFIWERTDRFKIGNVLMPGGKDYSMSHRWTIDYIEDYRFIKSVYEELYEKNNLFSYLDILQLIEKRPDIYSINSHLAGVNWYREHLHELKTISPLQTKNSAKA